MKKLEYIAEKCAASVSLEYRGMANYYETLEQNVAHKGNGDGEYYHTSAFLDGELEKCLKTDKYWCLHFNQNSPVGFCYALAHDLNKLLDWGVEVIKENKEAQK